MPSLIQLLASHRRILLLDAASAHVQVGLIERDGGAHWEASGDEAGRALFAGTATVLGGARLALDDVEAFAFCEGPGSMLGIRTVAMALRTWHTLRNRPIYGYQSLAIAACSEYARRRRAFCVIADARRERWHCQAIDGDGTLAPAERRPTDSLPPGERLMPANFRAWAAVPAGTGSCSYDLSLLLPAVQSRDLFRETAAPDAHQYEAPEYKKWSARVHSAELAKRP